MTTAMLGRLLILAALGFASAGSVLGFITGRTGSPTGLRWTRWLTLAFCAMLITATAVMEYALITNDFSVSYVAHVGSLASPLHIRIVSLWSSLEGSILFWGMVLALFVGAFCLTTLKRNVEMAPYTLGVIMFVCAFFAFLIAGPANPFGDTPLPIPTDGPGPNPLLQNHALMIVHPPMLYLGYVGMTIPFGMGLAALLKGRLGTSWMAATRVWMLLPWGFLTAGIVLGGWWAYEVLGWGGYWAWDPVENASLLPWLTATAFLHSAMLQERRGLLKAWALILLVATFGLTVLGTFMTRSGIFNSVHSFTQSDIGPTLLVFLVITMVASIALLAARLHVLQPGTPIRSPISREVTFMLNNLLFVIFTFSVLVGTTFPLVAEAVRGVKLSVGAPFFNQFALPTGVAIVFLMGIGPALPWGSTTVRDASRKLALPLGIAVLVTAVAAILGIRNVWPALTIAAATFASAVALRDMVVPVTTRMRNAQLPLWRAVITAYLRGRRRYGGQIVHLGVAMAAVAIALSGSYQQTREGILRRGQVMTVSDFALRFVGSRTVNEPHRQRAIAQMAVSRGGKDLGILEPAMNQYRTQMSGIGTPAVRSGPKEDLYLSVMQIDPAGAYVGLRVFINPAVPWLWIALGVMLLGCTIAVWPAKSRSRELAAADSSAATTRANEAA